VAKMERSKRYKLIFLISFIFTVFIMIFCITIGAAKISFLETIKIIFEKIPIVGTNINTENFPLSHKIIIWKVRIPRILLSALVGSGLAAVGGSFQGLFKNPMADPYIIGISSGASLGAAVAIAFGFSALIGIFAVPLAAFLGALLSTLIVYNLGKKGIKVPVYTLLLSGVALSAFFSALTSFVIVMHSKETHQIIYWMMGGFSGSTWFDVKIAFPMIIIGVLALCCFAKELNAMLFGDDTARYLGIDLENVKKLILILGAMTTAIAVAVSGTIGFVGLIIPHIVRIIVGPDHRALLPLSFITGGAFMVITDTIARTLFAPAEIPVGIITAMFGGPFFIYLLKRKKRDTVL
jgi:iron complex transport system permease protein